MIEIADMAKPATRSRVVNNRNVAWEQRLTDKGFEYDYVAKVPLSAIRRHPESQARMQDSPKELVELYASQIQAGSVFPPILAWADPSRPDDYALLDGNARTAANNKINPNGTIDAYIIKNITNLEDAVIASSIPNTWNGNPYTRAERENIALTMHKRDYSATTIARELGVTQATLAKLIASADFDRRAEALGMEDVDLPSAVKVQAVKVIDDSVFDALVRLCDDSGMPVSDVSRLVRETGESRSEADRLKLVADQRTERAEQIAQKRAGRNVARIPSQESLMVIGRLVALCEKHPDKAMWVPIKAELRDEWADKISHARDCLGALLAAYAEAS